MPGVPVPAAGVVDVETAVVSVALRIGVSTAVSAVPTAVVAVSAVPVTSVAAPKGVLVAPPMRVGVVCSAAQAAVISTRTIVPNKSRRENLLISLSP
jgi:hypothetical protein